MNEKLYIPSEEKEWPEAYWKRIKIFDPENYGCIMSETKNNFTIIDYLVDESEETVSLVHVCGPMPQIRTLLNILLVDKDVKECMKERWESLTACSLSVDARYGSTGHAYYTFAKWVRGHVRQVEKYEIEETSSGKLDFQAFRGPVPIWVLIAADYNYWRKNEDKPPLSYKDFVFTRNKRILRAHLWADKIRVQYSPGYRYNYLRYKALNDDGKIFTI